MAFPTEAFPTQTLFPATEDYGHYEELPGQPGEPLFPEHPLEPDSFPEGGPPGRPKAGAGVPDFLPSAQRALYLRIQQKQQEEERARRLAESSKQDRENEEGMCPPAGAQPALQGRGGAPRLGAVSEVAWQGGPVLSCCLTLRKLRPGLLCILGSEDSGLSGGWWAGSYLRQGIF